MNQAAKGSAALSAGNYAEAIEQYTLAISSIPTAVDYYIKRSTAHQRSSPANNQAALKDAETAIVLAVNRGKRELITQAQLRRAIALFGLERYADAGHILAIVKKLNEKEKSLAIWEKKIATRLESLPEGDERGKVTVKDVPDVEAPTADSKPTSNSASKAKIDDTPAAVQPVKKEAVRTPADKIKHEWYQNTESVYITVLAKGVPKDQATIEFLPRSLTISFPTSNSATFDLSFDPLFAEVDSSKSTFNITPSKIEIVLRKKAEGTKWRSLEGDAPVASDESNADAPKIPDTVLEGEAGAHNYPTSSRNGPKNWDKVASGLGDDDEDQNVDAFFQKLYKDADDDTRRAMVKSYQESNGTALSTNWSEVKRAKVETQPPDGMVAKKWGE